MSAEPLPPGDEARTPPARIDLFGFAPTPARVRVVARSTGWRLAHAFGYLGLCWLGMVAAIVPPHVPWLLAAFSFGIFFFVKYIRQKYTLLELHGSCPKCATPQTIDKPTRLGFPHRLHCPGCRQQLLLLVDVAPRDG